MNIALRNSGIAQNRVAHMWYSEITFALNCAKCCFLRNGSKILRSVPQKLRKSFANETPTSFVPLAFLSLSCSTSFSSFLLTFFLANFLSFSYLLLLLVLSLSVFLFYDLRFRLNESISASQEEKQKDQDVAEQVIIWSLHIVSRLTLHRQKQKNHYYF